VAHRVGVDFLAPIGFLDLRQQVAERQALAHRDFAQAEGRRDVGDGLAELDQPDEGVVQGHFVGIEARDVLDERGFERRCVVARLHDCAGERIERAALARHGLGSEVAPSARHDFEAVRVRADKQRLQDALLANAGQNVGHIRLALAVAAHVHRRNMQSVEVDMLKLHGLVSLGWSDRLRNGSAA